MSSKDKRKLYREFINWVEANNLLFLRFQELADCLEKYLLNEVFTSAQSCKLIGRKFLDVLDIKTNLNYNDPEIVQAYTVIHFLDRYHRFQMVYIRLIEMGIFPCPPYAADILDIGTGPAPALFAISDIYSLLKMFGRKNNIPEFASLRFQTDYVEPSESFRLWISLFSELSYSKEIKGVDWEFLYNVGSFEDFSGLDLHELKLNLRYDLIEELQSKQWREDDNDLLNAQYIIDHVQTDWKSKFRYDMIVFSNFLTELSQVETLLKEIRSAGYALRNRGILVVVGGRENSYPQIYARVIRVLKERLYLRNKTISKCIEIELQTNEMAYSYNSNFGLCLRKFYSAILKRFEEFMVLDCIPKEARRRIMKTINAQPSERKWGIHIFKKVSWRRRDKNKASK